MLDVKHSLAVGKVVETLEVGVGMLAKAGEVGLREIGRGIKSDMYYCSFLSHLSHVHHTNELCRYAFDCLQCLSFPVFYNLAQQINVFS